MTNVSQVLKLPETIIPLCVIVMSYPNEQPAPKPMPTREEREKNGDLSEIKVIIAKNRNGSIGTVDLFFQKAFSKFSDPTSSYVSKLAESENESDFHDFE